jgi:hypothetical protein
MARFGRIEIDRQLARPISACGLHGRGLHAFRSATSSAYCTRRSC